MPVFCQALPSLHEPISARMREKFPINRGLVVLESTISGYSNKDCWHLQCYMVVDARILRCCSFWSWCNEGDSVLNTMQASAIEDHVFCEVSETLLLFRAEL